MANSTINAKYPLCKKILEIQLDLLCNFTRSLAYYRAINQDFDKINNNGRFWLSTMNMWYMRAINDWCIIFGADSNESHWKKLSTEESNKFEKEIRDIILKSSGFDLNSWVAYHKEIRDFRNGYVAHKDPSYYSNVPDLTKAYEIACVYFEKLKEMLRPSKNEPEPLNVMFPKYQIEILSVLLRDMKK